MDTREPNPPQLDQKLCECGSGNVYCQCPPLELKPLQVPPQPNSRGSYDGN